MAAPGHVMRGTDGTSHSTCLHFEGFPAILWDTLRWFGYQSPPLYAGREYLEHGVQRCSVHVVVPPPPVQPQWPQLEVSTYGHTLEDTWESAALQALTQFCRLHPFEVLLDPIGLFPARDRLDADWLDRVNNMEVLVTSHPQVTLSTATRCMNALYRLVELQGRAMAVLARIAVDTQEHLNTTKKDLVEQSYQLIQRGIRISDMETRITELEEEVTDMEHDMVLLAEEKLEVEMELAVANAHLDEHHAELNAIHAQEQQGENDPMEEEEEEEDPEEIEGVSSMDFEGVQSPPRVGDAPSPAHSASSVGNLDDF